MAGLIYANFVRAGFLLKFILNGKSKIVHPITSTIKPEIKMMIPIPEGFKIQGSVIAEQIRALDLNQRCWKTTGEILPKDFVDLVVQTFNVIIS
ncbi:type II toxin-antitoxin system PemK/MazF family toxin [Pseudanabaena sp. FACHB-1277]|uniref:Type II toxin-antitoxin system PemK/MazF family toxin n=1 Tax=Pseudanabaena cinerea FACHB-1277 TaxID=2949581 RepID=A0A926Z7M5_9CYAN|nr:type II toxin-antitoxin system PemK/MazF family toxin [Pseudanabaena cinerea FACHB-1277]